MRCKWRTDNWQALVHCSSSMSSHSNPTTSFLHVADSDIANSLHVNCKFNLMPECNYSTAFKASKRASNLHYSIQGSCKQDIQPKLYIVWRYTTHTRQTTAIICTERSVNHFRRTFSCRKGMLRREPKIKLPDLVIWKVTSMLSAMSRSMCIPPFPQQVKWLLCENAL